MRNKPGPVLFFGSGETLPASGKAYEFLARKIGEKPRISILETPAGFQPNSFQVAREIADFLERRLQNYKPQVQIIQARHKETAFSPEDPEILSPLLRSNWIMMGPGSPTYAVRQLEASLAFKYITSMHMLGSALSLASAAVLALSAYTLPVYEIYKVGLDLHWVKGLNFFETFGLDLVFIPHWNNNDGGDRLDTSRCYMGKKRFEKLQKILPEDISLVGIDEHTAICFNFNQPYSCEVFGKGNVTVFKDGIEKVITSGHEISLSDLGKFHVPEVQEQIEPSTLKLIQDAMENDRKVPAPQVLTLLSERKAARKGKNWQASDRLREEILALGWRVKDTPNGQSLENISSDSG